MNQQPDEELLVLSEEFEEAGLTTMSPSQPLGTAAGQQQRNGGAEDHDQAGQLQNGIHASDSDFFDVEGHAEDASNAAAAGDAGLDTSSSAAAAESEVGGAAAADGVAADTGPTANGTHSKAAAQQAGTAAAGQHVASKPPAVANISAPRVPLHHTRKRPPPDTALPPPRRLPPLLRGPPPQPAPRFPPHVPPPPHWSGPHRPPSPPHRYGPPPPGWQLQQHGPLPPLRPLPPPVWQQPLPRGYREPEPEPMPAFRGPPPFGLREPLEPYSEGPHYMNGREPRPARRAPYLLDEHSPPPLLPPEHPDTMRAPYRFGPGPEPEPYLDQLPPLLPPELPPPRAPYRMWEDDQGLDSPPPMLHRAPMPQPLPPPVRYAEPLHRSLRGPPPPPGPFRAGVEGFGPPAPMPRAPYMFRP